VPVVINEPKATDSDDDIEKLEAELERDVKERDELAARIRERDKKTTRHVVSKSEAKASAEATKRLNIADKEIQDKQKVLDQLRYESRKQYLSKRKEDKKMELEAMVRDEEQLFSHEKLV
jgi:pre-mRNA-splicing factor ATP-dependent RNA helicase DHX16